jgi:4a-hydroxytetrahydrobiopterin dehydratase
MKMLTSKQVTAALPAIRGWKLNGTEIYKTFVKKDFVVAMGFVQSVALLAEQMDHHPDIDIRWNTVTLVLSTHSAGGLTQKDFALAQKINQLK